MIISGATSKNKVNFIVNCVSIRIFIFSDAKLFYKNKVRSARGVMVIVVENGHGDTSSNPG